MAFPQFQLLRSVILNKRPDPAQLLPGQPAVNTNSEQPGLFFADASQLNLFKVGPCHVGPTAPNAGAVGAGSGNCKGEFWLDNSDPLMLKLKVWTGSTWVGTVVS